MAIEVGQSVTFPFAGNSMQGIVVKVHPKTVVIRADFPKHKGKIVRRQAHELGDSAGAKTEGGIVRRFLDSRRRAKEAREAKAKAATSAAG